MAELLLVIGIVAFTIAGCLIALSAGSLLLLMGAMAAGLFTALGAILGVGFGDMNFGAFVGGLAGLALAIALLVIIRRSSHKGATAAAIPSDE